MIPQWT